MYPCLWDLWCTHWPTDCILISPQFQLIPTLTELEEVQIPQALCLPGGELIPAAGQLWQSGEAEGRLSPKGSHSVSQGICKWTHNVEKRISAKSWFSYRKLPVQPWASHSVSVFFSTWSVIQECLSLFHVFLVVIDILWDESLLYITGTSSLGR